MRALDFGASVVSQSHTCYSAWISVIDVKALIVGSTFAKGSINENDPYFGFDLFI